jgi:hypothetical protein
VTPCMTMTLAPSQTSFSIYIGRPNSRSFCRVRTLLACPADRMLTFEAICTPLPMTTMLVYRIVQLWTLSISFKKNPPTK